MEVYTDSNFVKIDTLRHDMNIYSIEGNAKNEIEALPHQVFCFSKNRNVKNLLLKIENHEFDVSTYMLRDQFAVLKLYMNANVANNNRSLVIKNGDAIYILASCTNCHKIEVIPLAVVVYSTGYEYLNDYIFK